MLDINSKLPNAGNLKPINLNAPLRSCSAAPATGASSPRFGLEFSLGVWGFCLGFGAYGLGSGGFGFRAEGFKV